MSVLIGVGVAALVFGVVGLAVALEPPATKPETPAKSEPAASPKSDNPEVSARPTPTPAAEPVSAEVLTHLVKRIDGSEENLSAYKGKVVLIVNVASKCGFTPQYQGLEKLYGEKKEAGLVVLGFPANNFRQQEPGSNAEIAEFCSSKFHVTFPMFEKVSVAGDDQHPLYKQLSAQPAPIGGDPKWNFTKFLVDRSGTVVARFEPKTKPDDPDLVKKIDELLAKK